MDTTNLAHSPIADNWTVADVLDAIARDDALPLPYDALLAVEAGLTARAGDAPWTRPPGAVALIRSIGALVRSHPALARLTVGEARALPPAPELGVGVRHPSRSTPAPSTPAPSTPAPSTARRIRVPAPA
ncbi:MAG TPA: hypothetical protein VNT50_05525 [Microbacterium sp.]|uniref:hypothetical protein n=1 Tax=Microbacterium sp. TaxID=51671 RepID=UPI002BE19AB7|nr:hypothetical protein [Microbacterium sp.]HWI30927.1 hypothetical protein [Microbacterium sp.]